MRSRLLVVTLAGLAASCATTPTPVPVSGTPVELSQLAGEWSGEYHSLAAGRHGTITFKLTAGADTAYGEVLMFPMQHTETTGGETRTQAAPPHVPHQLTIGFVRTAQGMVSGRLDPYTDPECGCLVNTVFEGRVQGDTIEGRYVANRSGATSMSGEWKVTRRK